MFGSRENEGALVFIKAFETKGFKRKMAVFFIENGHFLFYGGRLFWNLRCLPNLSQNRINFTLTPFTTPFTTIYVHLRVLSRREARRSSYYLFMCYID